MQTPKRASSVGCAAGRTSKSARPEIGIASDASRCYLGQDFVDALLEPRGPVRGDGLGQPGPDDQDVIAVAGKPPEPSAPDLAELPLDPVAHDGIPGRSRHSETEPRLAWIVLTLEPVEDEESGRGRAALAIDSVEISRAREAVPTLHGVTLCGETLPAPRATALQDRAARARRHARTKAVLALPPSNIGLVGAFHEVEEGGKCPEAEPWRASIDERWCTELSTRPQVRSASKCDEPSPFLHRCGEGCGVPESPANGQHFIPSFHAL